MGPQMTWKQRGLVTALIAVLLASWSGTQAKQAAKAVEAQSAPGSFTDPDDVNLPLDLKTLTHENDDSTISYTVETYEPFEDRQADFKWGIDKNNDQKVDLLVSVEWEENKLTGKVEDTKEKELGAAAVKRVGAHALRVSFSRRLLGSTSYQYQVIAVNDTNGNDEDDPGETDLAPDTGFQPHRL
jgi:hypothetical protein